MRNDGWSEHSQVAVLADGADGLADLVNAVSPTGCRSILDWFHISMRLRPIEQMAPKIAAALGTLRDPGKVPAQLSVTLNPPGDYVIDAGVELF